MTEMSKVICNSMSNDRNGKLFVTVCLMLQKLKVICNNMSSDRNGKLFVTVCLMTEMESYL